MTTQEAIHWARSCLCTITESDYLEAMILLGHILQQKRVTLITQNTQHISEKQWNTFQALVYQRCQGIPIAYLTQQCEFWSLPLKVTPACLIPRPETELLVEKILDDYPKEDTIRLAELGTGSGAIAIALAKERPHWQIIATDQSIAALDIAHTNAQTLNISNIAFRHGHWFSALKKKESFQGIISNPPYLSSNDARLNTTLRYEPRDALAAGPQGLESLYDLIAEAPHYLLSKGCLWLEQGYDQSKAVIEYLASYGYTDLQQYSDLAGILRVSRGRVLK